MKKTEYNEIVVDTNDLVELMLQDIHPVVITTEDTEVIEDYNKLCSIFGYEGEIISQNPDTTGDKYKADIDENWYMPQEYKQLNIYDYLSECLAKELNCEADGDNMYGTTEWKRICEELEEYKERGLFPLLKYMKFLVDIMRQNNIMWGVGRGSSVASYVLYLMGVHKIDSIKYGLSVEEFFR